MPACVPAWPGPDAAGLAAGRPSRPVAAHASRCPTSLSSCGLLLALAEAHRPQRFNRLSNGEWGVEARLSHQQPATAWFESGLPCTCLEPSRVQAATLETSRPVGKNPRRLQHPTWQCSIVAEEHSPSDSSVCSLWLCCSPSSRCNAQRAPDQKSHSPCHCQAASRGQRWSNWMARRCMRRWA